MAHLYNRSLYVLDADAAPTFNPFAGGAAGGTMAVVKGTTIVYFWDNLTTWTRVNIGSLAGADGNHVPIVRANTTEDVAPTVGEIPSPASGDSASVYLTNGKLEFWVFTTVWAKAYVLQADQASNLALGTRTSTTLPVTNSNGTGITIPEATTTLAGLLNGADKTKLGFITVTQAVNLDTMESDIAALQTLSGVAAAAVNLGTFTGTTIADNSTIKAALQALETALETYTIKTATDSATIDFTVTSGALTGSVILAGTQDPEYTITAASGLRITRVTPTVYGDVAAAQGAGGLAVGSAYFLAATNPDGLPSMGAGGPKFYKV